MLPSRGFSSSTLAARTHSDFTSFSHAAMLRRWVSRIFVNSRAPPPHPPEVFLEPLDRPLQPPHQVLDARFRPFTATALS
jgi:hypothetical protein